MKHVYVLLLLTCSLFSSNAQETLSAEQTEIESTEKMSAKELAAAEAEYNTWFNQLNEQLLTSTDWYEMSMGLSALLQGTLRNAKQQPDDQSIQDSLNKQIDMLNGLIQQNDLSDATLDLLTSWCFKSEIVARCNQDVLLNKQLQQAADNLNIYLRPLQLAIDKKDPTLVDKIIALMGDSKRSHASHFISKEFNERIDAYIKDHPIPDSAIMAFKDDKALLSGVSNEIKSDLDRHIREYFPASIKMSYVYLFETPETQPLYSLCKTRNDLFNHCIKITQILINDSNTIQFKGLGYAILMGMHENMGRTELLQTVQERQEKYKTSIQCLSKATQSNNFMDNFLDPKYQQINLLPIDEFKKLDLMATYVYQKNKADNPLLRNPSECYPASQ